MSKYLLMSTSPSITTGYGIVSNNLMKGLLKKNLDIKMLGLQTIGHPKEEWLLPIMDDIYGKDALNFYINLFKIKYLITIIDNWVPSYHYLPELIKNLNCKHICHVTANSIPLSPFLINRIKNADFWVAPSKFVEKLLLDAFDKEKIKYIPHGVNTEILKPLSNEEIEMHKNLLGYKDKFVFLSVGTNTGLQKNWAGLFYAYKIFLQNNPDANDVILHCHTGMHNPEGYDLELLAKRLGLKNVFFINIPLNAGTPQEEMVKLYNVSNCHISASMGESFGLPVLESMACGIPQIFPNHTTGPELIGKSGLLVDLLKMKNKQEFGFTTPLISDQYFVDPVDMAEKMEKIYKSEQLRKKFSKNAVKFAKEFDWEKKIIPKWMDFFNYVEEYREPLNYKEKKLGI